MTIVDKLATYEDQISPGISACVGCNIELTLRTCMKVLGPNTIFAIPPGCMGGVGVVGWDKKSGAKTPVFFPLLDNVASMLAGIKLHYEHIGRHVNVVAFAGDGASVDAGMQCLSGAAERGDKLIYICYDNEGYMNTGYQRSSTTSLGSSTSTTPAGDAINGKEQHQKYLPLIMAMHNIEYCATASPSNMADLVAKIQKGLDASKRGFAYLHVFSPCPIGWKFAPSMSIEVAKKAVASNMFPLWERENGKLTLSRNPAPITVEEFIRGIGKFKKLSSEELAAIQHMVDERYALLVRLAAE